MALDRGRPECAEHQPTSLASSRLLVNRSLRLTLTGRCTRYTARNRSYKVKEVLRETSVTALDEAGATPPA